MNSLFNEIDTALSNGDVRRVIQLKHSSTPFFPDIDDKDLAWLIQKCVSVARHIETRYRTIPIGYRRILHELFDAANRQIGEDVILYQAFADAVSLSADLDFPWERIDLGKRGLAVLYNFAPFADTGAAVASKRLRESAARFDVISCSSLGKKNLDFTPYRISRPYISTHSVLPVGPAWGSWRPQAKFIGMALDEISRLQALGNQYDFIYTRAMWVPSHYVGVLHKLRQPGIEWVAEFSDPLSTDVSGKPRKEHPPKSDPNFDFLLHEFQKKFGPLPVEEQGIFRMAELLPYAFADRIVFTNKLQRQTMIDRLESHALKSRVERVSVVSPHPTLPPSYYKSSDNLVTVEKSKLNIGYFGEFYASRGLGDLTAAMRMLPPRLLERLKLHVFTTYVPESHGGRRPVSMNQDLYESYVLRTMNALGDSGLSENIELHPSLPYTEFLSALNSFDLLLVNDAQSGEHHKVNPYLPSKYGDYKGSSSDIWAICEPNSCLDMSQAQVKTKLGDVMQARDFLYEKLTHHAMNK